MKFFAWIFPLLLALPARAQNAQAVGPKTETQKTLYALGLALGRNVAVFHLSSAELKYVTMGLQDSVQGKKAKVDLTTYAPHIETLAQERQKQSADTEKQKAKAFLAQMAKEKGAVTTPSGLIYTDIKKGAGPSPKATDKVKVHYEGKLRDGTVFDSSIQRGTPAEFPLNQVIPCWTEGVQRMKVGGEAKLVCPSSLAYGDSGAPPRIPGGAPLVFDVKLLEIVK